MKRRNLLRASASALAVVPAAPLLRSVTTASRSSEVRFSAVRSGVLNDPRTTPTLRDPRVKALALNAVDAARSAGARHAEARLTNTIQRGISQSLKPPLQRVALGLSVRALVNGYWGWAATPTLSTEEAVRVARLATQFATVSANRGKPRTVELGTIPVVRDGEWITPVKIDPFEIDPLDIHYWLQGMGGHLADIIAARAGKKSDAWAFTPGLNADSLDVGFQKQEQLFASSEGSLYTQTILTLSPVFKFQYRGRPLVVPEYSYPVQAGWEYIAESPMVELYVQAMDRADAALPLPPNKPADIGRYDMIFTADAMAQVLNATFGGATQVDRALGYEANAGGTSYLGPDPLAQLGATVASPLITITANRSASTGLATVKWDAEGVVPDDVALVNDGVLVDYQTTREQAAWLAPYYQKLGRPIRSHGCSMSPTAQDPPMQHTPNLILRPGPGTADVDTLVRDLEHGILIQNFGNLQVDWQCLDLYSLLLVATEIRHGKRVAILQSGGMSFRADQFWKNIQVLGGAASQRYAGNFLSGKGEPRQFTQHSIWAVPARIAQLAIIDPTRKA